MISKLSDMKQCILIDIQPGSRNSYRQKQMALFAVMDERRNWHVGDIFWLRVEAF